MHQTIPEQTAHLETNPRCQYYRRFLEDPGYWEYRSKVQQGWRERFHTYAKALEFQPDYGQSPVRQTLRDHLRHHFQTTSVAGLNRPVSLPMSVPLSGYQEGPVVR